MPLQLSGTTLRDDMHEPLWSRISYPDQFSLFAAWGRAMEDPLVEDCQVDLPRLELAVRLCASAGPRPPRPWRGFGDY
jgi:hypothetical protein